MLSAFRNVNDCFFSVKEKEIMLIHMKEPWKTNVVKHFHHSSQSIIRNIPWDRSMYLFGEYVTTMALDKPCARHINIGITDSVENIRVLKSIISYIQSVTPHSYFKIVPFAVVIHLKRHVVDDNNEKIYIYIRRKMSSIYSDASFHCAVYSPSTNECIYSYRTEQVWNSQIFKYMFFDFKQSRLCEQLNIQYQCDNKVPIDDNPVSWCIDNDVNFSKFQEITTQHMESINGFSLNYFAASFDTMRRHNNVHFHDSKFIPCRPSEKKTFKHNLLDVTNGILEYFPWDDNTVIAGGSTTILTRATSDELKDCQYTPNESKICYPQYDIDIFMIRNPSIKPDCFIDIARYFTQYDPECTFTRSFPNILNVRLTKNMSPRIQFIIVNEDDNSTIMDFVKNFDIDAVQCFYQPSLDRMMYTNYCQDAWENNQIRKVNESVQGYRLKKMEMKGFDVSIFHPIIYRGESPYLSVSAGEEVFEVLENVVSQSI